MLVIEYWTSNAPVQKSGGYYDRAGNKYYSTYKSNSGKGVICWSFNNTVMNFEKSEIIVSEIHFDIETCGWICKDKNGQYYRIAWPNAYQHPKYQHHLSRNEVNTIISSCSNIKIV